MRAGTKDPDKASAPYTLHGGHNISNKLDTYKMGVRSRNSMHYNLITSKLYSFKFYTKFTRIPCHCLLNNHEKAALIYTMIKLSMEKTADPI